MLVTPPRRSRLSARPIALLGAGLFACTVVSPFEKQTVGAPATASPPPGDAAVVAPEPGSAGGAPAVGSGGAGGGSLGTGGNERLEPTRVPGAGGAAAAPEPMGSAGSEGTTAMEPPADPGVLPPVSPFECAAPADPQTPSLRLARLASGLEQPIYVTAAPGDDARLFVIEKPGRIRVIRDGQLEDEPFLDITERVDTPVEEMGLLGLAFHPRYADNGLFYLSYSSDSQGGFNPAHTLVLAEFHAGADRQHGELEERRLLTIQKPQGNHNGGNLQFRADGLLYAGIGDGGGANDEHGEQGNGQALDTLLGKLLRIDVDGRGAGPDGGYAIPPGNYAERDSAALPEIWSVGLRNPWRFSFDACTADLYIGDVGQETREEVDFAPGSEVTGRNFGWRLMEAETCFNPERGCDAAAQGLTLPIASYGRATGQSITGGYVYRGSLLPGLRGAYLYADYEQAVFFALRVQAGALAAPPEDITENLNPGRAVGGITSFGQDNHGELYITTFDGEVFRIEPE